MGVVNGAGFVGCDKVFLVPLPLPEPKLLRSRPARHRQLDRLRPLGQGQDARMLYCRSCKARFFEPKGTPLFRSQLTEEKALSGLEHLADRNGVRATARLVKVNRDTVLRLGRIAGGHARPPTPRRTRGVFPPRPVRSSSTRSGRSWPRSRLAAIPTITRGTGGTTWRLTPNTGWCCASNPARATPRTSRTSRPWSPASSGVGAVEIKPVDQHVVRGAAERHGPPPQRPEGPRDVHVLEGLAGA